MIPLESDERILTEVRAHPFNLIVEMIVYVLGALFPILLFLIISFIPNIEKLTTILLYALPAYPLWFLLLWERAFSAFTFYYLHYLVITNERIIEVEQRGYFNREISVFRLENIQDITVEIVGIIPSVLNFGDLKIQTASKDGDFRIPSAPNPDNLKLLLSEAHENAVRRIMTYRNDTTTNEPNY